MKILLTGGGTGGHFYPLIAVAEAINDTAKKENLVSAQLYFMSDSPYDMEALIGNDITFIPISAGKIRGYVSALNFLDFFLFPSFPVRTKRERKKVHREEIPREQRGK